MKRLCAVFVASIAMLVGLCVSQVGSSQPETGKKPNIVFILVDNLGYGELGVYGGGILRGAPTTPRIDKLASEGTRLLNFNVEAQCTPTRSALMTGRLSIRSGTYAVPAGGQADGLTLWEITIAEALSDQGYATGMWGKWHLGSAEERLPTHQGFDEWYGIPRTYDEAMWPSLNEAQGMWPSFGNKQGWNASIASPEPIYDARKGEKAKQVPIIFDGLDLSDSLLGKGAGKRTTMLFFASQSFGAIRVKNFKFVFTAKDTWLGPSRPMKVPAVYDLQWDPGEQFDMAFNGAMPTNGNQTSPGRYSGTDNGWTGVLFSPVLLQFFDELKTHPNVPYVPGGEGLDQIIPKELQ